MRLLKALALICGLSLPAAAGQYFNTPVTSTVTGTAWSSQAGQFYLAASSANVSTTTANVPTKSTWTIVLDGTKGYGSFASSVTASSFFGDLSHGTGALDVTKLPLAGGTMTGALTLTGSASSVVTAASVTASAFFGDASHMANTADASKLPLAGGTMTGALSMTNVAINLSGAGGNIVSAASVTASAFFGVAATISESQFSVGASTLVAKNGFVGIGTTNPVSIFDVRAGNNPYVSIASTGTSNAHSTLCMANNPNGANLICLQAAQATTGTYDGTVAMYSPYSPITIDAGANGQGGTPATSIALKTADSGVASLEHVKLDRQGVLTIGENASNAITLQIQGATNSNSYIAASSSVTASAFFGDGHGITGVTGAVTFVSTYTFITTDQTINGTQGVCLSSAAAIMTNGGRLFIQLVGGNLHAASTADHPKMSFLDNGLYMAPYNPTSITGTQKEMYGQQASAGSDTQAAFSFTTPASVSVGSHQICLEAYRSPGSGASLQCGSAEDLPYCVLYVTEIK